MTLVCDSSIQGLTQYLIIRASKRNHLIFDFSSLKDEPKDNNKGNYIDLDTECSQCTLDFIDCNNCIM